MVLKGQESSTGTVLVRRRLGRKLRRLRELKGLSLESVADEAELSRQTVGKMEAGEGTVRYRHTSVKTMLDLYDASDQDRELVLGLAAETRLAPKVWRHDRTDTSIPDWFDLYNQLEGEARVIRQYEAELVPGLLQTENVAEAIMRSEISDEDEIRRRVNTRMSRQHRLLQPRAPRLEVILNEATLHRIIGAGDLAQEQLDHLIAMTHHANVEIRLLPFQAGFHAGMATSAGFSLLEFPATPDTDEEPEPALLYLDAPTGATYSQKETELAIYQNIWSRQREVTLNPEETRTAIAGFTKGTTQ